MNLIFISIPIVVIILFGSVHFHSQCFFILLSGFFFSSLVIKNHYKIDARSYFMGKTNSKNLLGWLVLFHIYILISICNYRAEFDNVSKILLFKSNTIKFLPTTLDPKITCFSLLMVFAITLYYFSSVFYLFRKTCSQRYSIILKLILFGTTISIIGIIQKICSFESVLGFWSGRSDFWPNQFFSVFGYRSNAATFIGIIFFLNLGLLVDKEKSFRNSNYGEHNTFIVYTTLVINFIAILLTGSRGAIGLLIFTTMLMLAFNFKLLFTSLRFYCILILGFLIGAVFYHVADLNERFYPNLLNFRFKPSVKLSEISLELEKRYFNLQKNWTIFALYDGLNLDNSKAKLMLNLYENDLVLYQFDRLNNKRELFKFSFSNNFHIKIKLEFSEKVINSVIRNLNDGRVLLRQSANPTDNSPGYKNGFVLRKISEKSRVDKFITDKIQITSDQNENSYMYSKADNFILTFAKLHQYNGRFDIYKSALSMLKDNNIFGVGLNLFSKGLIFYRKIGQKAEYWAHNDILQLVCEVGIIGMLILIMVAYNLFYTINFWSRNDFGISSALLFVLLHSIIDYPLRVTGLGVWFVLLIAFKTTENIDGEQQTKQSI